jgi:hypothetical protein
MGKFIGLFSQELSVGSGHKFDPEPVRVDAQVLQYFFSEICIAQGIIIPMGDIIAFIQFASADKNSVLSACKGPEDKLDVHSSGTHDPDESDLVGIL